MKEIIDVNTGEVTVASKRQVLRSTAIGSCIVIAAWDSRSKVGALAHVMLPGKAPETETQKAKYAEDAIDVMLARMTRAGANAQGITVCLVGAGNVLKQPDDTVCEQNTRSVKSLLAQRGIPVKSASLGGTERKGVVLDVETGRVTHTLGDGPELPLCNCD